MKKRVLSLNALGQIWRLQHFLHNFRLWSVRGACGIKGRAFCEMLNISWGSHAKAWASLGKLWLMRIRLTSYVSFSIVCMGGAEDKYTIYILLGMSSKHSCSSHGALPKIITRSEGCHAQKQFLKVFLWSSRSVLIFTRALVVAHSPRRFIYETN